MATACGGNNDTTCAACDANCDTCNGPGACTTCSSGYGLNGGTCVVAGTSCLAIHTATPAAPSGVYMLDPNGGSPADSFLAYCDMTNDGGGWMKILQIHDAAYTPTAAAIGNVAVPGTGAMAKLADANINSLTALAAYREYRFQGDLSTQKLFIDSSATWDDTARGEGLVLTGTTLACESTTNCAYVTVTTPGGRPSIDSNDWSPSSIGGANNQDRYFTDYSATPNCYATSSTTQRCYDAGASTGHALIPNLSIWVREAPLPPGALIIYPLNEGSGTAVGDTSGSGNNATVIQGSWITAGHTGTGLAGALRTAASVPVTNAVTVSVWVRRDGTGSAYPRILGWNGDGFELADAASTNNLGVYTPGLGWQADRGRLWQRLPPRRRVRRRWNRHRLLRRQPGLFGRDDREPVGADVDRHPLQQCRVLGRRRQSGPGIRPGADGDRDLEPRSRVATPEWPRGIGCA